jgi:hypothetical protein
MSKTGRILGSVAVALSLFVSGPALGQDIEFGDDSSRWANDGQCDDPRFEGPGAAAVRIAGDEGRDAADCHAAFEAGTVTLIGASTSTPSDIAVDDIDFGDDSGNWANDGECDDPRFGGSLDSHRMADATDCREAYEADPSIYSGGEAPEVTGDIDFGDDSGSWANDGECDDPRFGGSLTSHEMADATDCREAYDADPSIYSGGAMPEMTGDIDFGDDSGNWANDGECDDPRFGGTLDSHRMADATDCRTAYDADPSIFVGDDADGGQSNVIDGIDFGNDDGEYSNDGECDDPRFEGSGMGVALDSHYMADATDCSIAYSEGNVTLKDDTPDTSSSNFRINFGDDSGGFPNDGECDDPRFQGRGAAMELYDDNILGDATDCRAAYEAGTVTYQP